LRFCAVEKHKFKQFSLFLFRYQDLVSLIDFMYHGEVAIPTEDVAQFLGLAEQFKVDIEKNGLNKP
jgi:hypothetical protein